MHLVAHVVATMQVPVATDDDEDALPPIEEMDKKL